MPDPDKDKPTEIDLELEQQRRLMELFNLVGTYDDREAVIAYCQHVIEVGNVN